MSTKSVPMFELSSYEPVEIELPEIEIPEEEVERLMLQIASQHGHTFEKSDRTRALPNDTVKLDMTILLEGERVDNLCGDGRVYTLASGMMPLTFDANLANMEVGESKTFTFMAPRHDQGANGEQATYTAIVKLLSISGEVKPELTDEWVQNFLPFFKDVEDLRKNARKQLRAELDQALEGEREMMCADVLADRLEGTIEDEWYETVMAQVRGDVEAILEDTHTTLEQFLEARQMTPDQYETEVALQARSILRQGFALDAWARHFGIEPGEGDLVKYVDMMTRGQGKQTLAQLRAQENVESLQNIYVNTRRLMAKSNVSARAIVTMVTSE